MKLHEIREEIEQLIDAYEYAEDADVEEIDNAIHELKLEYSEKIEGIALYCKNLSSDIDALKAEENSFKERRKALERTKERVESYLKATLDGNKFTTAKVAITWRKSESVQINGDNVPDGYINRKVVETYDKAGIKKAIKAGIPVEGAELVTNNNMSIK